MLKTADAGLKDMFVSPRLPLPLPPPLPEKLSQPSFEESSHPLFVGKYDYISRADDDLDFNKGDLMHIINADEDDWWYARSKDTGLEGYIPSNYVAEYNTLDAEE